MTEATGPSITRPIMLLACAPDDVTRPIVCRFGEDFRRWLGRLVGVAWLLAVISSWGCSKHDGKRWSCNDFYCHASKDSCIQQSPAVGQDAACKSQAIAYCKFGCQPAMGGFPACREHCAVDEKTCDEVETMASVQCQPMKPPKNSSLYPNYSAPGWWCWQLEGPEGRVSQCLKGKQHCEWNLHDVESKLGLPNTGQCSSRGDVECFSLKMDGGLEYQCATTNEECNFILKRQKAMSSPTSVTMTDFSDCRPWAFGADNDARRVSRPKKTWKPEDTLVFEVADDNPDPVRTVKLMRDRTSEPGVAEAEVELEDREITVHLPGLDAETKAHVVEMLTREVSWTAHRVGSDKALMESIATWASTSPEAEKLGVQVAIDADGSPHLLAEDRRELLTVVEAKARDCWHENMLESGGKVQCLVTGREVLEMFVKPALATDSDLGITIDSEHDFAYGRTASVWRSYYIDKSVVLSSADLKWAAAAWNPDTQTPLVEVWWYPSGLQRLKDPLEGAADTSLAILFSDSPTRVSGLTRPGKHFGGHALIPVAGTHEGSKEDALMAETQDLENVLRAGLPMGVRFKPSGR